MSVPSPATLRDASRSRMEVSPELKARDLNVLLKDGKKRGSSELFVFAREDKVYIATDLADTGGKPEKTGKLLDLIKKKLSGTSHSGSAADVLLNIRTMAKGKKLSLEAAGIRKEANYVAVESDKLNNLLVHRHDPNAASQLRQRSELIVEAVKDSMKPLQDLYSADAALQSEDDKASLHEPALSIGSTLAATLLKKFQDTILSPGKQELAFFSMYFLTEHSQGVLDEIQKQAEKNNAHKLDKELLESIRSGLQQSIGNVSVSDTVTTQSARKSKTTLTTATATTTTTTTTTTETRAEADKASSPPFPSLILHDREFIFSRQAGKGGHGVVNIYESPSKSSSRPSLSVAVKSPSGEQNTDPSKVLATCQLELALHLQAQGIGHENVVEILGAMRIKDQIHIVMEDCSIGSLDGSFKEKLDAAVVNNVIKPHEHKAILLTLAHDVIQGLHFLHDTSKVLHLDMKPGNVFIGIDGKAKIGDFDRSKKGSAIQEHYKHIPDTPQYVSPRLTSEQSRVSAAVNQITNNEAASKKLAKTAEEKKEISRAAVAAQRALDRNVTFTHKDDVFAAGVTLFEIFYGENPFLMPGFAEDTIMRMNEYAAAKTRHRRHMLFDKRQLPPGLQMQEAQIQKLLMGLLHPIEDKRTTLEQAGTSALFTDVSVGTPEARELIRSVGMASE